MNQRHATLRYQVSSVACATRQRAQTAAATSASAPTPVRPLKQNIRLLTHIENIKQGAFTEAKQYKPGLLCR